MSSNITIHKRRSLSTKVIVVAALFVVVLLGVLWQANTKTEANFNAGNIIDDAVFTNYNSMNAAQIQQFLNQKNSVCLKDFRSQSLVDDNGDGAVQDTTTEPYGRHGTMSAAELIAAAAQIYRINPQVILVTLQKEQGLITRTDCPDWRYNTALGYGCPDNAPCDNSAFGFTRQIDYGNYHFRGYFDDSLDYVPFSVGTYNIAYNPDGSCGSSAVNIQNRATASLYSYTPYQPNAAALAAGYGEAPCGAYGNRNFYLFFRDWFGSGLGDGFILAKSNDPNDLRQWVIYRGLKQHIPNSQIKIAWGLQNVDLVTMSATSLNAYDTGPALDRLMRLPGGSIYFVDAGKRYRIPWDSIYGPWNLQGVTVSTVTTGLFGVPVDGGEVNGFSVKDPASSTIYMVDGRNASGQTVLRPYANDTVRYAIEGPNTPYMTISTDYWDQINDAIGASLTHTKLSVEGSSFEVMNRYRFSLSANTAALYPGVAQVVSTATRDRMPNGGVMNYLLRSANGASTYLVDAGTLHQVQSPDILKSWTVAGTGIVTVNDQFASLIATGSPIGGYFSDNGGQLYLVDSAKMPVPSSLDSAYRATATPYSASTQLLNMFATTPNQISGFIKARSAPQAYFMDNSGKKRHIEWSSKLSLLGGESQVMPLSDHIVNSFTVAASPQIHVSDGTIDYVLENGNKLPLDATTRTNWGLGSPQVYNDGTLARFPVGSPLTSSLQAVGGYFAIRNQTAYGTVDKNIADAWGITNAPARNVALISNLLRQSILTRFITSSTDSRTFLVDQGQWYNLPDIHKANLGVSGQPAISLNPNLAPNTISDWTSRVVKNAQGTHFVIDGGGKRTFPHPVIQSQWTNNGAIPVPVVSDGFLNSMPTRGIIERTIKGSGPSVYFVENNAKRHILYSDTYNRSYAPFVQVTDPLLNTLPDGPPII